MAHLLRIPLYWGNHPSWDKKKIKQVQHGIWSGFLYGGKQRQEIKMKSFFSAGPLHLNRAKGQSDRQRVWGMGRERPKVHLTTTYASSNDDVSLKLCFCIASIPPANLRIFHILTKSSSIRFCRSAWKERIKNNDRKQWFYFSPLFVPHFSSSLPWPLPLCF